jgi:hypothetical protein
MGKTVNPEHIKPGRFYRVRHGRRYYSVVVESQAGSQWRSYYIHNGAVEDLDPSVFVKEITDTQERPEVGAYLIQEKYSEHREQHMKPLTEAEVDGALDELEGKGCVQRSYNCKD